MIIKVIYRKFNIFFYKFNIIKVTEESYLVEEKWME